MPDLGSGVTAGAKVLGASLLRQIPSNLALKLISKSVEVRDPERMRRLCQVQQGKCVDGRTLAPFDERKAIFIHVPKTGGTSIKEALFNSKCGGHLTLDSYALIMSAEKLSSYFKFCFVRNPWDRLVSSYTYLAQGGNNRRDRMFYDTCISKFSGFEDFVRNWLNRENIFQYVHFLPQTKFVVHRYGLVKPDLVARYEHLEAEYRNIAARFGISVRLPHSNKSKRTDFRNYYSDKTREIVASVYSSDIHHLGYTFE